jgi:two-component system, LuxR family, response regulator FixJ
MLPTTSLAEQATRQGLAVQSSSVKVHLIDDHDAFRTSTVWLLEAADFQVQDYPSANEFLKRYAHADGFGCIVSDVRMPGISGLELVSEVQRLGIALPILLITGHGDVPLAVEAMQKGAANFIEKPFSEQAIVSAILAAIDEPREAKAERATAVEAGKQSAVLAAAAEIITRLSVREHQLFEAVISGKANKIISRELNISIKTVELHRAKMMAKFGVRSIAELFHFVFGR